MMSLWAPNATLTVGPGETAAGLEEIRQFFLDKSSMFQTDAHWVSDHPAYKVEITVNGDRGTLHFECHYIDYDKYKVAFVTTADLDVARIDGQWLIANMVAGSTELDALSPCRTARWPSTEGPPSGRGGGRGAAGTIRSSKPWAGCRPRSTPSC